MTHTQRVLAALALAGAALSFSGAAQAADDALGGLAGSGGLSVTDPVSALLAGEGLPAADLLPSTTAPLHGATPLAG